MLTGSVGEHGRNIRADVVKVQQALKSHGGDVGAVDGACGRQTIAAIRAFQSHFMSQRDGLVEPGGATWRRLSADKGLHEGAKSYTTSVLKTSLGAFNPGLSAVNNKLMTQWFGTPRASYGVDCQPVTNAVLAKNMVVASVGALHVQGLSPAVASLRTVVAEIQTRYPDLYALLGTAGMLCCRYQRGSSTAISNHSWGTAIDLKIAGVLDTRGDGKVQYGLTLIAPIFNKYGWYWGAGFHTEDAMHFEGGRALTESWKNQLV